MKIIFEKIQDDGQGSFHICDDFNNKLYHFLTQIGDEEKLKTTLKKYIDEETAKAILNKSIIDRIAEIIDTVLKQ